MHVVHFAPRFLPIGEDAVVGGSNNGLWNLAVALRSARPDIGQTLVTATNDDGAQHIEKFRGVFDDVVWRHIPHDRSPIAYGASVVTGLLGALLGTVRRLHPQVIHGHSGYPHYAAFTGLIGRLTGTAVVHSLYCPVEDAVHDQRRLIAHPTLARVLLAGVDHILPMSDNVDRSLAALGLPAARRTILRPGLRPSVWRDLPSRAECRRRFGFEDDERVALFVGNPSWAKGIDLLLDAAAELFPSRPGARLACTFELAYGAREGRAREVAAAVERSPVHDRIRFFGLVPRVTELMRAADVAVFPFRNTSGPSDLPLALMECMAVGTPVVASALPGNIELLGEDGALFSPGDTDALTRKLAEILDADGARRENIGSAGAERLARAFAPEAAAELIASVYEATVSLPRR